MESDSTRRDFLRSSGVGIFGIGSLGLLYSSNSNEAQMEHLHSISGSTHPQNVDDGYHQNRYKWTYKSREWEIDLKIPRSIHEYYSNRYAKNRNYGMYAADPYDDEYIQYITSRFETFGEKYRLSENELVELAVSFVQQLRYTQDDIASGFDHYANYPIETLIDRGGDCEDTSILLGALLREMGHDCKIFYMPYTEPNAHMALGIHDYNTNSDTQYEHDGKEYHYIETTSEGWGVGDMPEWGGDTTAIFLNIDSHPAIVYDYITEYVNGKLLLRVEMKNVGSKPSSPMSFSAEFIDQSGNSHNTIESPIGQLEFGEQTTINMNLNPPTEKPVQLKTSVLIDGEIHDADQSDFRKPI